MDQVASQNAVFRKEMFDEAAIKKGIPAALLEKDFWVCWVLKHLFLIPELKGQLIFKGGTTLSKAFNVIKRFSEDIDLTLNRELIGFTGQRDPNNVQVFKKRERLLRDMAANCSNYIRGPLTGFIRHSFEKVLGLQGEGRWNIDLDPNDKDQQTLLFYYPQSIESLEYVQPVVRLELGCRSIFGPSDNVTILPYVAELFSNAFETPECKVSIFMAEATFWEKITILHRESYRTKERRLADRFSRHYYDVAMMAQSDIRVRALHNLPLLKKIIENKQRFFRCGWANYNLAIPGSLCLMPSNDWLSELKSDYNRMKVMMFEDQPSFDEVLRILRELENEINKMA